MLSHNYPTSNSGMQKWKLSWNTCTLQTRFCTFGTDLYAQLVLTSKISASELSRKFYEELRCWLGTGQEEMSTPRHQKFGSKNVGKTRYRYFRHRGNFYGLLQICLPSFRGKKKTTLGCQQHEKNPINCSSFPHTHPHPHKNAHSRGKKNIIRSCMRTGCSKKIIINDLNLVQSKVVSYL